MNWNFGFSSIFYVGLNLISCGLNLTLGEQYFLLLLEKNPRSLNPVKLHEFPAGCRPSNCPYPKIQTILVG